MRAPHLDVGAVNNNLRRFPRVISSSSLLCLAIARSYLLLRFLLRPSRPPARPASLSVRFPIRPLVDPLLVDPAALVSLQ
jgi:hypothetical protein